MMSGVLAVATTTAVVGTLTTAAGCSTGRCRMAAALVITRGAAGGRRDVEGRRGVVSGGVIDVELLEKKMSSGLVKRREGTLHLDAGNKRLEFAIETTKHRQHQAVVTHGVTELGKGTRHGLQTPTIVGDGERTLLERAEFRGEEKRARLPLAEKFIVEDGPGDACRGFPEHDLLLQISGDGAVNPGKDCAVHLHPRRALRVRVVGEDMVGEGVLPKDDEEQLAPAIIIVGGAVEGDGNQHLDVDDRDGLRVDGGVLGLKSVEFGLAAEALSLGALAAETFRLSGALACSALILGGSHGAGEGWSRPDNSASAERAGERSWRRLAEEEQVRKRTV
jgi:hypothetical protein